MFPFIELTLLGAKIAYQPAGQVGERMRQIPLSRRSHIIGFRPLATGTAKHESALERDFVTLTSFLDARASIMAQPLTLFFRHEGRPRHYTPDYAVRWSDGRNELVEIKYQADLITNEQKLRPAFAAAEAWSREHGAVFRTATEHDIRGPLLKNAQRLLPFRGAPLDERLAEQALAAARSQEAPTFGAVLAAMPADRSSALATIWRLIARGTFIVELSAPIRWDTPLGLP